MAQVNRKEKWFNLMLISHTQKCIVIPKKKAGPPHLSLASPARAQVGERVNLEADCLGKARGRGSYLQTKVFLF